jgi:hypothetical protein
MSRSLGAAPTMRLIGYARRGAVTFLTRAWATGSIGPNTLFTLFRRDLAVRPPLCLGLKSFGERLDLRVHAGDLTAWLRAKGGAAQTSMRRLALELGRSLAGFHVGVGRLAAAWGLNGSTRLS